MHKFFANLLIIALFISLSPSLSLPQAEAQTTGASCPQFTRNLALGQSHTEVQSLQKFLNEKGFAVSSSGAGSPGLESLYFGLKTKSALIRFQTANNISPTSGYFGPITRAKIISLCSTSLLPPSSGVGFGISLPTSTPAIPVISTSPSPTSTISETPAVIPVTPKINSRSIVGILCTLRSGNQILHTKGSGVIVNQQGYVLTARHIVDPKWTLEAYKETLTAEQKLTYQNAVLDSCEIGLPEDITLPDPSMIRSINPSTLITRSFQYKADLFHLPSANGLSTGEYNVMDIAVLKITGPTYSCPFFNSNCNEMGRFPYSPIGTEMPRANLDEILSYGYPADGGFNDGGQSFYNFYLKGAVGHVGIYFNGDQKFSGLPLQFSFQANNIQGGRSGSPIFYKGKVIGILFGSTSTQESYNVTISSFLTILKEAGYGWILATE